MMDKTWDFQGTLRLCDHIPPLEMNIIDSKVLIGKGYGTIRDLAILRT